jgi:hypothetical protein
MSPTAVLRYHGFSLRGLVTRQREWLLPTPRRYLEGAFQRDRPRHWAGDLRVSERAGFS